MYPKVFTDFAGADAQIRPGLGAADAGLSSTACSSATRSTHRASKRGKSLVVRLQAVGETDEEGQVRVFFELNGQPRIIARAQPRAPRPRRPRGARPRRATTPMSPRRCRARSPPSRSRQGQTVKAGDVLLTIEAMKMETALARAARRQGQRNSGVRRANQIDAKDLLVVFDA